ncbi:MAG: DUF5683 domain-containing protein [Spirochaetia bacterium]|nr:DUF5683 domain-containing protein [Spirochaetia bacterium]
MNLKINLLKLSRGSYNSTLTKEKQKKRLLFLLIFIFLSSANSIFAENEEKKSISPVSALWRSAIFPGWGQMHRGDNLSGKIFGTTFLVTVLYNYQLRLEYKKNLDLYNNQAAISYLIPQRPVLIPLFALNLIQTQSYYEQTKTNIKNVNRFTYLLTGIYLWNLADAYFNFQYRKKDKSAEYNKPSFYFIAVPEKTDRGKRVSGNFTIRMAF